METFLNIVLYLLLLLMVLVLSVGAYAVVYWHKYPFIDDPAPRRYEFTLELYVQLKHKWSGQTYTDFKVWYQQTHYKKIS